MTLIQYEGVISGFPKIFKEISIEVHYCGMDDDLPDRL